MTLQIKLLLLLATLLVGFGSGFGVRAYMAHTEAVAAQNAALHDQLAATSDYAKKLEDRDTQIATLNRTLYANDLNARKSLDAKLTENDQLRTDLAAAQRMSFRGAVCPKQPAAGQAATSGVVGHDPGLVLTADARRDVLDLRASILADISTIEYLRGYIHQLGLDDPGSPPLALTTP